MAPHVRDIPRPTRVIAMLVLVVPVVAWLALVWDTRPYSDEQIRADRERVEALPAYEHEVEECRAIFDDLGSACDEIAFAEHTAITRKELVLDAKASLWSTLGLAVLALVIGARWPGGTGVRGLLRAAVRLFALVSVTALVVGLAWWWGLEWVAEHRRLEHTAGPRSAALRGAVLVGLAAVVGFACAQLRGALVRTVTISVVAVALGLVLLLARPVAPWLPALNVEALLLGDATYDVPRDQLVCIPASESAVGYPFEYCIPDERTRTGGEAALYLVGTTVVLLSVVALTRTRRRARPRTAED